MAVNRSVHENKYDRQMRLWGSHGQEKLETSNICCIGSGPTASEALKNLVLPNVRHFTIIDDHIVNKGDLGNNFFLSGNDSIGKARANIVKELLEEMNEVQGNSIIKSPKDVINNDINHFKQYNLVITSQLLGGELRKLSKYCYDNNIPLIVLRTVGLLGTARLQINEHLITESHPSNDRYDLYIHPQQYQHWKELQDYVNSFKLDKDSMDGEAHAHVPYLVILAQQIAEYQKQNNGKIPSTYDEKKRFKDQIVSASWNFGDEGNFGEAHEFAHRAYELPKIDNFTQQVYNDKAADVKSFNKNTHKYWILVAAIKAFVVNEGHSICYPVSQDMPDMHSKTAWYVQLKQIFKNKAEADIEAVTKHAKSILKQLGRDENEISASDIVYFVKNCRNLRCIRTRPIEFEYSVQHFNADYINELLEEEVYEEDDEEDDNKDNEDLKTESDDADEPVEKPFKPLKPKNIYWYLLLRVLEEFYIANNNTHAGSKEETWENDAKTLKSLMDKFINEYKVNVPEQDTHLIEKLCIEGARYGGCEPHNIAAFMGGVAAQIGLKVLLQQYVPINNTLLFNGIHGSSSTFNL